MPTASKESALDSTTIQAVDSVEMKVCTQNFTNLNTPTSNSMKEGRLPNTQRIAFQDCTQCLEINIGKSADNKGKYVLARFTIEYPNENSGESRVGTWGGGGGNCHNPKKGSRTEACF